ncbi:hypothetical protein GCM10027408_21110 [Microbacterium tumbae]
MRQAFFRWLFPAAFVLPLWLLVGWGVFNAGGWAFLGTIFIAIPSVLLGQLVLTLLVRSRPSVRVSRAVSWWDVAGFSLWHVLTILVGCYPQAWFGWALAGAIVVAIALFWLSLWQLWNEARGTGGIRMATASWRAPVADEAPGGEDVGGEVFVIREKPASDD